MAKQPFTIVPLGGMVTGNGMLPHLGPQALNSFRSLVNARLGLEGGHIEQTEGFIDNTSINQGSVGDYWNRDTGAAVTEASTEKVRMLIRINATTYSFYRTGVRNGLTGAKIAGFRQITVPNNSTLTGGCMAVFSLLAATSLALGQLLEVEIDGATTFKYRLNGGAYTTLVPIASSVVLGATGITLYFATTTGFTVGNEWEWIRDDACFQTESTAIPGGSNSHSRFTQWPSVFIGNVLYFLDFSGRLMKFVSTNVVMSAGYRPVYGTDLCFYENHLFITNFLRDSPPNTDVSGVLGCSDNLDVDQFIPTDTNEADTYSFLIGSTTPGNQKPHTYTTAQTGIFTHQGVLFVITNTSIWWSTYSGLGAQSPFNFRPRITIEGDTDILHRSVIVTPSGGYIIRADGVHFFDGSSLQLVSYPINRILLRATNDTQTQYLNAAAYDITKREVYFWWDTTNNFGTKGFLVYQENQKAWYFRAAHFDSNDGFTICIDRSVVYLGGVRKVYSSTETFGATLAHDYNAGASFQLPTIETQNLDFGDLSCNKDVDGAYMDTRHTTTAASGSHDTTGVSLETWVRQRLDEGTTYSMTYTQKAIPADGNIGVRASAKVFRFRIKPTVGIGKAAHGFNFYQLTLFVHGLPEVKK